MIYKTEKGIELVRQTSTLGCKFSNNIHLLESFLISRKIPYDPKKLQYTPLGPGLIVDNDKGETLEEAIKRIQ